MYTKFMETSAWHKEDQPEILPDLDACPYLGLEHDSDTWLAYPHPANFCHRAKPTCNLSLFYQENTCLANEHKNCPGFINGWNGPLPDEFCGEPNIRQLNRNYLVLIVVFLILLLAVIGWLAIRSGRLPALIAGENETQSALIISISQSETAESGSLHPSQTSASTTSPTPILNMPGTLTARAALLTETPAASPSATFSATPDVPTPGPALKTLFGPEQKYLLHQLASGESLGSLVTLYNTSNKVIEASNVFIVGASIWPGTVLLIVPGEKNPDNVIRFRVIVTDSSISIEDLASLYNVSIEDIRFYNSLGVEDVIPAGRYLIFPAQ